MSDRYLRFVLSVIALELLWLGLGGAAIPVSAQREVTPVVITGISLNGHEGDVLPVAVQGTVLVETVPYRPGDRPGD